MEQELKEEVSFQAAFLRTTDKKEGPILLGMTLGGGS